MEIKEMNIEQIEARLAEIRGLIDTAENIDELSAEVDGLKARKAELAESAEKRTALLNNIANNEVGTTIIKTEENRMEERKFTIDSAEYRSAWLKNLMGKALDEEERTAVTATSAIPTATLNEIVAKFDGDALLGKIDMMHFPSYVKIPVESSSADASWTTTSEDSADSLSYISLNAYQLIKTVEVPADVNAMSISAFETYLVDRLYNKIRAALKAAVISGDGNSKATGISQTLSTATGTFTKAAVTKKDLLHIMGSLDSAYQANATWIMPAAVFYDEVMALSDHNSFVNINNGFETKLFGHDVLLEAGAVISSTDNIMYGDLKHYRMNLAEGIKLDKDGSVGFRSNSQVYRAVCLADGKLDMSAAFVRYTRATA